MNRRPSRLSRLNGPVLSLCLPLVGACALLLLNACRTRAVTSDEPAPAAPSAKPRPLPGHIEINEAGFAPSRVIVENAEPLVFRRTTDKGCATAVIFPEFKIEKPLPLNADVTIVLPPTASGEVAFQCGVGQNRGKVVASVVGS